MQYNIITTAQHNNNKQTQQPNNASIFFTLDPFFRPGYFDPNKIELRFVFKNSEKRLSPSRIYNLQLSILDLEEEKGFFTRAIWYNESQVEEEANEEVEEKTPKNEAKIQVVAVLAQPYKPLINLLCYFLSEP
ncbi:hypothetical protein NC651_022203 [Populus alba x Populus x berolinensis]|nr:hypothetical protein NC651_022182 [Populus alba x Populus x berolinensis]KAJ6895899.1 hypothetical protein NC651_022203 [Populus alba x Populus x berolinensis]